MLLSVQVQKWERREGAKEKGRRKWGEEERDEDEGRVHPEKVIPALS